MVPVGMQLLGWAQLLWTISLLSGLQGVISTLPRSASSGSLLATGSLVGENSNVTKNYWS